MSTNAAKIQSCRTKTSKIIADLREFEKSCTGSAALNACKAIKCYDNATKFLSYIMEELQSVRADPVEKVAKGGVFIRLCQPLLQSAGLEDAVVGEQLVEAGISESLNTLVVCTQ